MMTVEKIVQGVWKAWFLCVKMEYLTIDIVIIFFLQYKPCTCMYIFVKRVDLKTYFYPVFLKIRYRYHKLVTVGGCVSNISKIRVNI